MGKRLIERQLNEKSYWVVKSVYFDSTSLYQECKTRKDARKLKNALNCIQSCKAEIYKATSLFVDNITYLSLEKTY